MERRTKITAAALAAAVIWVTPTLAFEEADIQKLLDTRECIGCDLSGADLFGQDLSRAVLSGSDLSGADLTGVILYFAIAQGSDFTGANMTRADLYGADLYDSSFDNVDLTEARICHTVMPSGQRSYNQCGNFRGGF